MVKIHVGCGPKYRKEGWINVDCKPFSTVDYVLDVTKEWPFTQVDYIYSEHFLEHLPIEDAIKFLYLSGSSLKEGAWMRISTPNVEWVLKDHYDFPSTLRIVLRKIRKTLDPLLKTKTLSLPERKLASVYAINRAFHGWGHQFLYSPFYLHYILKALGFVNIRDENYGHSSLPVFNNVEEHGRYSTYKGHPSVIIIEAQKQGPIKMPEALLHQTKDKFIQYREDPANTNHAVKK